MTDTETFNVEEEIKNLRNDLSDIKKHAEAILHVYMRTEAVLPSIVYDLKKRGVLKWINIDSQEALDE